MVGPPFGLILLYAGAWIVELSCRLLGGKADSAGRPCGHRLVAGALPGHDPVWGSSGLRSLAETCSSSSGVDPIRPSVLISQRRIPEFVLSIWCMVVTVKTLGEVQRFSAWRALTRCSCYWCLPVVLIVVLAVAAYFLLKNLLIEPIENRTFMTEAT